MRICVLADLPGRSVATTCKRTKKLERFDEIRTRGKNDFENKFLKLVFQLSQEIIIY